MLWPNRTNAFMRRQLFLALGTKEPSVVLDQWGQYKKEVVEIPDTVRRRILTVAVSIVDSFSRGFPVRAVLAQGHADQDLLKHGEARTKFEREISQQRAFRVMNAVRSATTALALDRARTQQGILEALFLVGWQSNGLGATRRVKINPRNEFERSLNRRVEIFLAHSMGPSAPASLFQCEHGGLVLRKNPIGFPRTPWYKSPALTS